LPYNPFTLTFTREWAQLETAFQHAYFRDSLTRLRIALLVGIFLYGIFGVLDAVMVPDKKHIFWFIRYALVIPSAAATLIFSFHKTFERWYQPLLSMVLLVAGLAIEAMVVLARPPANYSYYAGIILVFIMTHTFFRIGFLWASGCSFTILIVYEIISLGVVDTPTHMLINNNFFFVSSALLCILAGYSIELNARQRFFSRHLLTLEKEKVSEINENLDSLVKKRTQELSTSNQRLHNEMKERLAAQEKRLELEQALNRGQRLESIGTLAGGIAHDFNNILAAIIGYTELIKEDAQSLDSDIGHHASQVLKASLRARELTGQILTFSRQSEQPMAPLEIAPVVEEALKLIRASIPSTIEIKPKISSKAWVISDPTQIHRIIINLCTNAVQAMPRGTGTIEICLEDITPDQEKGRPAAQVQLQVKDSGQGMTKEIMAKIFDPFFTTRAVHQGTGMGLSVVHGIVKKCRGRVLVDSEPEKGSTFTILLPSTREPKKMEPPRPLKQEAKPPPQGQGEHILVLDDEPVLVRLMKTILPGFGYQVTGFTDAHEALAYVKAEGKRLNLVITDFSMPKMNGLEFAREIKTLNPQLPVVLCTGYSEYLTREKMDEAGIRQLLMKPVTRQTLKETVTGLLPRPDMKN